MRGTRVALFVHLIWATWNREPLLTPDIERAVYRCLEATCRELGAEVLALGGIEDHLHLVARLPATLSVAALVKHLKGASSHLITHEVALDRFFKWQGGYAAFSTGLKQVPDVCTYVRRQKEHHHAGTIIPTYEPEPRSPREDSPQP
jgi:REP element-mobilizing transposase RayT